MNIGAIWGLILAVIFILVIYIKLKKKTKKEVKILNVARPKETTSDSERERGTKKSKPDAIVRATGKKPKGKSKKSRRIPTKSSKARSKHKSESGRDKKRVEPDSPTIPSVEPFKE